MIRGWLNIGLTVLVVSCVLVIVGSAIVRWLRRQSPPISRRRRTNSCPAGVRFGTVMRNGRRRSNGSRGRSSATDIG